LRVASGARSQAGFTLIELVISAALMSVILVAAYSCLTAAVRTQKLIEPRSDVIQSARVALTLIAADLRSACPLPKGPQFLGFQRKLGGVEADNLDFATHNYTPKNPNEGDFCEESIFLDKDPKTGRLNLMRRRNPTLALDPLSGGKREELATGILGLKLEYYDGFEWFSTWGDPKNKTGKGSSDTVASNLSGMPEAVRVTLSVDSDPAPPKRPDEEAPKSGVPVVFQTIVRLNVSPAESSDTSTTGPGNSGSPSGGQNSTTTLGGPSQ
jgi:prepilin-type N-terminal cleavage/methylation domain-containing protein